MKVQLVLPLALVTSVVLVGFIKIRLKEHEKEEKRNRFQDIKMRVTSDVLQEYHNEKIEMQNQLDKAEVDLKAMEEEVKPLRTKAEKVTRDLSDCDGSKKSSGDQLAAEETNLKNLNAETEKDKTEWSTELQRLKKELAEKSPVCNFLKETPDQIKTLCGIKEEPKAQAPKQEKKEEPPKQEEPKAEAPKQEEKKEEPPKQEEPKAEAPKQEEKKEEPPKQEEPKAEAPKQEEKKEEPPKQEEPKAEAPKQEEKKEEPPKQEEPKAEAPKQEEKKEEPPKQEEPKAEAPKQEEKKEEPPKQEEPKAQAPKPEEKKEDAPKQ